MNYSKEFYDAMDVGASCFIFASAGSGKTKILVDRYVKTMFMGIKPEEILCITFTNAAVFEMKTRISAILEKLYLNENDFTAKYLRDVFQIDEPTSEDISNAENLFFLFQNSLANLKILTIHSFCQSLLQQFPLEAGISPNFKIAEEKETAQILQKARENVLRNLNEQTIQKLSDYFSIYTLESLVNKIQQFSHNFEEILVSFPSIETYEQYLVDIFKFSKHSSEFSEEQKLFINEHFDSEDIEGLYLTANGTIRKKIPFAQNKLSQEIADIVFENLQNKKKQKVIEKTCAFLTLVKEIRDEYNKLKETENIIDFSDVLFKTQYLLTESYAKEFVLSKICSKIKSIMIDEAQDLSKIQWNLMHLFSEDIYSDPNSSKTIFVVGDIKQSIYRFQGANYNLFSKFYEYCAFALAHLGKNFKTIYLNINYRSDPEILDLVDQVFLGEISNFSMNSNTISYRKHVPFHADSSGKCAMFDLGENENPAKLIAQKIIELKSENSLILTRSRTELSEAVLLELSNAGVKLAPPDKVKLNDNLLIMDLLAIADICINNQNDFALCCFLKSPYFFPNPLSNEDLFEICHNRSISVFQLLCERYTEKYQYISKIIEKYDENELGKFFYYLRNLALNLSPNDTHVLDAFMDEINKFSENYSDNIPEFIKYFRSSNIQITNQNISKDCIRLATIHSSKGLEADTIFLLDFDLAADKQKTNFIFSAEDYLFNKSEDNSKPIFFIKPSQKESFFEINKFIEAEYLEEEKELYRLLYVALTRPRHKLYIFGEDDGKSAYNLIKSKGSLEEFGIA